MSAAFIFTWRRAVRDSHLSPTQRHVAHVVSFYADEDGRNAYPSAATIARETGYARRTVIEALGELRSSGWLSSSGRVNASAGPTRGRSIKLSTVNYAVSIPEESGAAGSPLKRTRSRKERHGVESGAAGSPLSTSDDEESTKEVVQLTHESGAAGSPNLFLTSSNPRAKRGPKATDDPLTARAHRLSVIAFEQKPRPTLPRGKSPNTFAAVLSILRGVLDSGVTDKDLETVIRAGIVDNWSTRGVANAIRQAKRSGATGVSYDTAEVVYR